MADDANPCINLSQAIIQYTLKPSENQSFSVFRGYENVTSQPTFIGLQDVLKTFSIHVLKDVFRVTILVFQDVFKTSWKTRNLYNLEKPFSNKNERNDKNDLFDVFSVDGLGTGFGSISSLN